YGPVSYYLIKSYVTQQKLRRKEVFHIIPYFIFSIIHVILLCLRVDYRSQTAEIYMQLLYILVPISLLSYGLVVWILLRKIQKIGRFTFYLFMVFVVFTLIVLGSQFGQSSFDGYIISESNPF